MPDVTVDDVDQLPAIARTHVDADDTDDHAGTRTGRGSGGDRTGDNVGGRADTDTAADRPHRFTRHPGEVAASIAIWRPDAGGTVAKHYDTRIRYITDDGPQILTIVVPAIDFLPLGTRVEVEEQSMSGRVRVHRAALPPVRGMSWKRPDLRGALIVLAVIVAITAVIGVVGYLVGRSKQPTQEAPSPPAVTVQQNGQPVQQEQPGDSGQPTG